MFLEGRRENLDNDTDLGIVAEPQIDCEIRFVYLYEQIVLTEQIHVFDQLELRTEERSDQSVRGSGNIGMLQIEESPRRRFLAEPELHPQSTLRVVGVFGDQIDRQAK